MKFAPSMIRVVGVLVSLAAAAPARADTIPLDIVSRGENRIRLDGVLGDWRRLTQLIAVDEAAQVQSGQQAWQGADDASFGIAFARDEQLLYLAAEIHDDQIVRSREHRATDDAIVVSFAAPAGASRTVAYEFALYPGSPGNYGGAVEWRGTRSGSVPGAIIVEAPLREGSGFVLEATIPWRNFPEVPAGLAATRARAAYQDNDTPARNAVQTVIATGPGDALHPNDLAPMVGSTANSLNDLIAQFIASQHLDLANSLLDRNINVAGDSALERIVVFPGFIAAAGPGIAGGTRYAFQRFTAPTPQDVVESAIRDVTGDGHADVILRLRASGGAPGLVREVLFVYGAEGNGDQLELLFAAELSRTQGANSVSSRATYENGGGIRVTFQNAVGYTQQNYPRMIENNVLPALTPWSENRVVVYRWNQQGQRFDVARAESNPGAARSAGAPAEPASAPPTARAMSEAPTLDAVLRQFRQARGIAESTRPAFWASANFSGDSAAELLQLYGRNMVLTGAHFMNGRSYFSVELPANSDADVLGLTTADVTDDGRPEALVRIRRTQAIQVRGQTLELSKEMLLVYSLDDAHRGRIFAAETSRRVGDDAIVNAVRTPPGARGNELTVEAGRPVGRWNAQTYPFHDNPIAGVATLLLPWESPRRVYRWNGSGLAAIE